MMSGCEEEAMAIVYARNEVIDDILYYIDCNCCNPCGGQECIEDMNCKVDKIIEYINNLKGNNNGN